MSNQTQTPSELGKTGKLDESRLGPMMPDNKPSNPTVAPRQALWRILLQISGDSHTTIGLDVKEKIVLGRAHPDIPQAVDLDLTAHGADKRGVSRRHAQLSIQSDALFIEDLNSTNGTRLNGYILVPSQRYRLQDGDELMLGQLRIILRFIKAPQA